MSTTVPATSDSISFISFIASTMHSTWPARTWLPTSTNAGAPAFAEVGDRVKKGQVLCIVEAMKLMNEIESEIDAEVVEIRVANGQPVEYGEALFKIRRAA